MEDLCDLADGRAGAGGYLLIEAPPGHGKSWVCQQVLEVLHAKGWLVAEHYCYLGDSDGDRSERVLAETILGSLLGRLAGEDRRIVSDNRPYLAADEETPSRHSSARSNSSRTAGSHSLSTVSTT